MGRRYFPPRGFHVITILARWACPEQCPPVASDRCPCAPCCSHHAPRDGMSHAEREDYKGGQGKVILAQSKPSVTQPAKRAALHEPGGVSPRFAVPLDLPHCRYSPSPRSGRYCMSLAALAPVRGAVTPAAWSVFRQLAKRAALRQPGGVSPRSAMPLRPVPFRGIPQAREAGGIASGWRRQPQVPRRVTPSPIRGIPPARRRGRHCTSLAASAPGRRWHHTPADSPHFPSPQSGRHCISLAPSAPGSLHEPGAVSPRLARSHVSPTNIVRRIQLHAVVKTR